VRCLRVMRVLIPVRARRVRSRLDAREAQAALKEEWDVAYIGGGTGADLSGKGVVGAYFDNSLDCAFYEENTDHDYLSSVLTGKMTRADRRHYCERRMYRDLHYFPDLRHPRRLTELVAAHALCDRDPNIVRAADNAHLEAFVTERIGAAHAVKVLGVYESVAEIDLENLPERFVLKLNSGWDMRQVMPVAKASMNRDELLRIADRWLFPGGGLYYRHMGLTAERMPAWIVAEEYIDSGDGRPVPDSYKIYCYDGSPRLILCEQGRMTPGYTATFTDISWHVLPCRLAGRRRRRSVPVPPHAQEMLQLAAQLSHGFKLLRVEMYDVGGRVLCGDITSAPGLFLAVEPAAWDRKLGRMLRPGRHA